ncbi:hypothetical protein CR513_32041, partial [Mucuna pruriens]
MVFLNLYSISWKTKKQQIVSQSFVEVEYHSIATTVCELKWNKCLFASLEKRFNVIMLSSVMFTLQTSYIRSILLAN